ncbi:helix-turn-helix domain-containing protein [Mycobacteroides chelonae]|uniref:helix-turn-helix domain-containing protein n=1 Tax=Mycobacteroides chelonae TaxID=1774 RepID=UPI0035624133
MRELDDIARAAGVDTDSAEYRLATALAEADGDLLEQLVEARKAKGLTQQVVAERMRRDKSAVSNFERLGTDPHLSTIRRYAAAIGMMIRHDVRDFDTEVSYSESTPILSEQGRTHRIDVVWPSVEAVVHLPRREESWTAPEVIELSGYQGRKAKGAAASSSRGARRYG